MKARDILNLIQHAIASDYYAQQGDVMRRDAMNQMIENMILGEETNEDQ
jgi:vesicle coat complex subunit